MKYVEYLQPCDVIVVYNPRSWLHRVIRNVTSEKAGHVALNRGDGTIVEATSRGIKINNLKKYKKGSMVYLARASNLDETKIKTILKYTVEVMGQKYAFGQLFAILLKYTFKLHWIPDVERDAQICSEFIANAFLKAGIRVNHKHPHEIVPGDYLKSDNFTVTVIEEK